MFTHLAYAINCELLCTVLDIVYEASEKTPELNYKTYPWLQNQ